MRAWQPLLEGQIADDALQAVAAIARSLAVDTREASAMDRTLYWAYTTAIVDEPFANAAYDAALDQLVRDLQRGALQPSLLNNGLAGMGFAIAHVLEDSGEALDVIDEVLLGVLDVEEWHGHHDLAQGLVGYGVYFLERLAKASAPTAMDGLARVVAHLDRLAQRSDDGACWHTPVELLPAHYHAEWPNGHYDCGVAHGAAGTIAFLAQVAGLDGAPGRARPLCEEAMRWLARQRLAEGPGRFPSMVGPGNPGTQTRAAWCYGDPGVATALWSASARLGNAVDGELARETARDTAARDEETCWVLDAGLCHGAVGLAHLCNRFYQASGDAAFGEAARTWFTRTLAMRAPDDETANIGGFTAWRGNEDGHRPIANLLEGAMGIGLALAAAITPSEPSWDRLLLCEVPLPGGS